MQSDQYGIDCGVEVPVDATKLLLLCGRFSDRAVQR
jgi:hypothetical protein